MFKVIAKKGATNAAQAKFAKVIRKGWTNLERRTITWRPSSIELEISHNGRFWFASKVVESEAGGDPRHWNSFGSYERSGNLQIAAEINLPIIRPNNRVSAFVVKERETGDRHVLHDGGVGGGVRGITTDRFLEWSGLDLVGAATPDKDVRNGIIVASLDDGSGLEALTVFLDKAIEFKRLVKSENSRK
jgi:hypothetical protein